jgi:hypothetical protein
VRGHVLLSDYDLVIWMLGEESTQDETFSDAEQALVSAFLAQGGRLIVSGAELGWDLEARGTASDKSFLNGTLRVDYLADATTSSGTGITPVPGDIFDGITGIDYGGGPMVIGFPDVLGGSGGSRVVLRYAGTSEGAAVAWRDESSGAGVIAFGFPVSMVASEPARTALLGASIGYLLPAGGVETDSWVVR